MMNEIPQSSALAEASGDSLGFLMDKLASDPEGLTRQDRDRIVSELRAQRQRFALAEATKPKRASKLASATSASEEESGL